MPLYRHKNQIFQVRVKKVDGQWVGEVPGRNIRVAAESYQKALTKTHKLIKKQINIDDKNQKNESEEGMSDWLEERLSE